MLKQAAIIESTKAEPVICNNSGDIIPESGTTVIIGGNTSLKVNPNVTQIDENGNTINITSGISYEATASGSAASVSVDQNGNITITGNDIGNCDITVNILYNGAVIGTQKVKLNVRELTKDDILQNATIPNGDSWWLKGKDGDKSLMVTTCKASIDTIFNAISETLLSNGVADDKVTNAIDQAKTYYYNLISTIINSDYIDTSRGGDNNDKHDHNDGSIEETFGDEIIMNSYHKYERDCEDLSAKSASGIAIAHSYNKDDTYRMFFNGNKIMEKVLSYLF